LKSNQLHYQNLKLKNLQEKLEEYKKLEKLKKCQKTKTVQCGTSIDEKFQESMISCLEDKTLELQNNNEETEKIVNEKKNLIEDVQTKLKCSEKLRIEQNDDDKKYMSKNIFELQDENEQIKKTLKEKKYLIQCFYKQLIRQNKTVDTLKNQQHQTHKAQQQLMDSYHENEVLKLKKENEKIKEILKNEIMGKNELLENEKMKNQKIMDENIKLRKILAKALETIASSKK